MVSRFAGHRLIARHRSPTGWHPDQVFSQRAGCGPQSRTLRSATPGILAACRARRVARLTLHQQAAGHAGWRLSVKQNQRGGGNDRFSQNIGPHLPALRVGR